MLKTTFEQYHINFSNSDFSLDIASIKKMRQASLEKNVIKVFLKFHALIKNIS